MQTNRKHKKLNTSSTLNINSQYGSKYKAKIKQLDDKDLIIARKLRLWNSNRTSGLVSKYPYHKLVSNLSAPVSTSKTQQVFTLVIQCGMFNKRASVRNVYEII